MYVCARLCARAAPKEESYAIESQAIGRALYVSFGVIFASVLLLLIDVHVVSRSRQGQQKKLVVLRLVCEGTIEQVLYVRNTDPSFALQSHRSLVRANMLLRDTQVHGEQSVDKPEAHETKREDDTQVRSLDEMDTH